MAVYPRSYDGSNVCIAEGGYAVACCRRVWASLEHEEFRDAVRKAELFADGLVDRNEMLQAHEKARPIFVHLHEGKDNGPGAALTASAFPSPPKSVWERITGSRLSSCTASSETRFARGRCPAAPE